MRNIRKRKSMLLAVSMLAGTMLFGSAGSSYAATSVGALAEASQMKNASIANLDNDTRTFKVDKDIEAKNVRFQNRYGFEVAGHMYLPKGFDKNKKYKAVVITGPFGAVKEQASGLYAQEMAKNGYVAVAFDQSMTGESSGERRNMASPDIFTEDYSAAVDFVSNLKFVDADRIGAVGICGLSGMALTAASNDTRIKAVATSAMYDMSESISDHYKGDYYTPEQREAVKKHLAKMRDIEAKEGRFIAGAHEMAVDAEGSVQTYSTMFPDKLPEGVSPVIQQFYDYYVGRAYHPRAINSNTLAWDATAAYGFFNFSLMENIKEISPRPVLFITGENAHSKYFADAAYEKANSPKEEIVVPGANHCDLYDQMDKIPFDRLVKFFDDNMK
ncbi:alpha/beta hydrolase [Anaerovibrio sp.]|uniref:alpha/beta hydrolase n=1 Tax=Anaerovibrio sp. TaxID=1872532 RepID=UPI003F1712B9